MSIPKILHQIWLSDNKIPDKYKQCMEGARRVYKDLNYILWTDKEANELIQTKYPEHWNNYNKLPRYMMKIEFLHYIILHAYGGLYLDCDVWCEKPGCITFDFFEHKTVIYNLPKNNSFSNCLMASEPGNNYMRKLMDSLPDTIKLIEEEGVNFMNDPVMFHPRGTGCKRMEHLYFNGLTNEEKKEIHFLTETKYCAHECYGSWHNSKYI